MTETYKILGQTLTTPNTEVVAYTVPENKQASISSIVVSRNQQPSTFGITSLFTPEDNSTWNAGYTYGLNVISNYNYNGFDILYMGSQAIGGQGLFGPPKLANNLDLSNINNIPDGSAFTISSASGQYSKNFIKLSDAQGDSNGQILMRVQQTDSVSFPSIFDASSSDIQISFPNLNNILSSNNLYNGFYTVYLVPSSQSSNPAMKKNILVSKNINSFESNEFQGGIVMSSGDQIKISSNLNHVSVHVYGVELS